TAPTAGTSRGSSSAPMATPSSACWTRIPVASGTDPAATPCAGSRADASRRSAAASACGRVEREPQGPQPAARDVGPDVRGRVTVRVQAQVRQASDQRLDGDLRLEPRQRGADAEVRPEPEPEVAGRRPAEEERV